MCGIIAYVGHQQAVPILLEGLRRLEFRGYDSAGLATIGTEGLAVLRTVRQGRTSAVNDLEALLQGTPQDGTIGVGHTRWSTHGRVTLENAHPHRDASGKIAVVHNGKVLNHDKMRVFLEKQGVTLEGQTDTEVLTKLIGYYYAESRDFVGSVQRALCEVRGTFGIAVMCTDLPRTLVAAARGATLVAGFGHDTAFVTSNEQAMIGRATQMVGLNDNQLAILSDTSFELTTLSDRTGLTPVLAPMTGSFDDVTLGDYRHYLEKEIHEQPDALTETMRGRVSQEHTEIILGGLSKVERELASAKQMLLFGCGTAWHAGLIGRFLIEECAQIPTAVDISSELATRNPIVPRGTVAIAISQSGDTANTLSALHEVKCRGALTLGVVNITESRIPKETDAGVFLCVGVETSVASTKAFTGQIMALAMIAAYLGRRRALSLDRMSALLAELSDIPQKMRVILEDPGAVKEAAELIAQHESCLYLGRGINYPVALEGALKLKELSYIHAEGLPAAELKHGHLALVTEGTPIIAVVPPDAHYEETVASLEETKSRGARIIAVTQTRADDSIDRVAEIVFRVPDSTHLLSPLLTCIPLQLLAYHVALLRGVDIDRPRNLAKSVVV